jgi:hypothetical protein
MATRLLHRRRSVRATLRQGDLRLPRGPTHILPLHFVPRLGNTPLWMDRPHRMDVVSLQVGLLSPYRADGREWALIVPCYLMLIVLLTYWSYSALVALRTPPFDSPELITGKRLLIYWESAKCSRSSTRTETSRHPRQHPPQTRRERPLLLEVCRSSCHSRGGRPAPGSGQSGALST